MRRAGALADEKSILQSNVQTITAYPKGGDSMEGYKGKVKNTGNQVVDAPVKMPDKKGGKVKKGNDLRTKGGK
jgi:hypothetical protein